MGAVAGILADMVVTGVGLSLLESIVVGIVGAFLGGWLFGLSGIAVGGGILGTIFTAFMRIIQGGKRNAIQ